MLCGHGALWHWKISDRREDRTWCIMLTIRRHNGLSYWAASYLFICLCHTHVLGINVLIFFFCLACKKEENKTKCVWDISFFLIYIHSISHSYILCHWHQDSDSVNSKSCLSVRFSVWIVCLSVVWLSFCLADCLVVCLSVDSLFVWQWCQDGCCLTNW